MKNAIPKTLQGLGRRNANVRAACTAPDRDHVGIYRAETVAHRFYERGWDKTLEGAARHFRCNACGETGPRLSIDTAREPDYFPPDRSPVSVARAREARQRRR